jgi:hypothetical protein
MLNVNSPPAISEAVGVYVGEITFLLGLKEAEVPPIQVTPVAPATPPFNVTEALFAQTVLLEPEETVGEGVKVRFTV